jgi:hypothetical protein
VAHYQQNPQWFGGDEVDEVCRLIDAAVAAERERCAQYLRGAAERLAPDGRRINQIDRHTAHVLATKGDELAHGRHLRA